MSGPGLTSRPACPVCGRSGGEVLVDLDLGEDPLRRYLLRFYEGRLDPAPLAGERYVLLRCPDCGLVYQRDVPDPELLDLLYGHAALADPSTTATRRGLPVRIGYLQQIESAVRFAGRPPSEVEVLDFGAGTGLWLDAARGLGCRTTGAELRDDLLDRIRERGHPASALDELPEGHFDLVNTEQVVEHLVDPAVVVARLARLLRPGGVLRISVPNGTGIADRLDRLDWDAAKDAPDGVEPICPLEHLNCFDAGSLERLGRTADLVPFRYPLRVTVHRQARLSFALGSIRNRLRPPPTVQLFRRP